MPELGRGARARAALAVGLLGLVLAAPAALAQTGEVPSPNPTPPRDDAHRWASSSFSSPFDGDEPTLRTQPFAAAGVLRYEKRGPTDHITRAEIRIVDGSSDAPVVDEDCPLPLPAVVPGRGESDDTGFVAVLRFDVSDLEIPCNGRYLLEAEGSTNDPGAPSFVLRRSFVVGMLPEPVTDLAVVLDEDARRVDVEFTPLSDDELAPDAIGYVLERSGPSGADDYVDVGTLDVGDEPRFVDDLARADGGTYTYRVRATRHGADEPERSSVIGTETAAITIGEPPTAPESDVDRSHSTRSRVTVAPRRSTGPRSTTTRSRTTATTIDTGFDDEIDYGVDGTRSPRELSELGDDPLAGQSVIRDEGDGMDLAAPMAGALVLLGWAGHIAYLNRLAKQL